MKISSVLCGVLACLGSAAIAAETPKPVPDARGIGQHVPPFTAEIITVKGAKPTTSKFDSQKAKHVTAYIFVGTTCPATTAYVDRFKEIENKYGPRGVDFIYLYPNRNDTHEVQQSFHKEKGFSGPLIDDHGGDLARLFNAKRTTEIFVADKKGIVVFHGGVDDSREPRAITTRYLAPALDEVLAGKPVTTPTSEVFA